MVSVIIPIYIVGNETHELVSQCVQSLVGADEIILQYDFNRDGFSKTVNKGVARSKGDYIAIVNDDTKMLNGSLKDMCRYNSIVRPQLLEGNLAKFAFVVMPRYVWDNVGGLSEDYELGFYEDDEFLWRAEKLGVNLVDSPFQVWHKGGATIKNFMTPEIEANNKAIFESKKNAED